MKFSFSILSASLAFLTLANSALADITYLTQLRRARASTGVPAGGTQGGLHESIAPDFNPFSTVQTSHSVFPGISFDGRADAITTHDSSLLPDRILASGLSHGEWVQGGGSAGGYSASGSNHVEVTFRLATDSPFYLDMAFNISSGGGAESGTRFSLTGPAGFTPFTFAGLSGAASTSGMMPAGDYSLIFDVGRGSSFPTSRYAASMDLALVIVPAPGAGACCMGAAGLLMRRRRRFH